MKKIPEITCLGCNNSKPKNELIRIVKNKENKVCVDLSGKMNGRGAYICSNLDCLEKVIKSKRLSKIFEIEIDNKIYEDLRDVIGAIPKEN